MFQDDISGGRLRAGSFDDEEAQHPPRSQFFGYARGVGRFGLLAGGSLAATLLFRQFPVITPIGWLLLTGAASGVAIVATFAKDTRLQCNVLLLSVVALFGLLCGTWDAIRALFVGSPLLWQLAVVAAVFVAMIAIDLLRQRGRNDASY